MGGITKKGKGIIVIAVTIIAVLFTGVTALGAVFPDNPIIQLFVSENTFTTPQEETFSILQVFEENGFSRDRIENIQLAVLPYGEPIIITDEGHIQAVWDVLLEVEVTAHGAERAGIHDELATYVDFQFLYPNENVGIEMFGPVHVLGLGPFKFADGSSEQPFIDLFTEFASIYVDITIPEPNEQYPGVESGATAPQIEVVGEPPTDYIVTPPPVESIEISPTDKAGNVTVISNGVEYEPYRHFLHGATLTDEGVLSASGTLPPLEELFETLPRIQFADDFQMVIGGKYATTETTVRVVVYNEMLERVYYTEGTEDFSFLAETGSYLLSIETEWRRGEEFSSMAYIFKIANDY